MESKFSQAQQNKILSQTFIKVFQKTNISNKGATNGEIREKKEWRT